MGRDEKLEYGRKGGTTMGKRNGDGDGGNLNHEGHEAHETENVNSVDQVSIDSPHSEQ